ncbi:MAG: ATP-binding protein [Bacteroidota bacterium]
MLNRNQYINSIKPFIDKPLIKAITGVRRCGKSTLLTQLMSNLEENGIKSERIIYINKELIDFDNIKNYLDLDKYVKAKLSSSKIHYLFIDEVQEVDQWEKTIASLLAEKKTDIYITGSNARLLSSELATLLAGRYIEVKMQTLTFSEFNLLSSQTGREYNLNDSFEKYLRYGGFPGIHALPWDDNVVKQYIQSLYSTIILKDVIVRYNLRDAYLLEKITEFLISNCGNITSANKISEFIKSQQRKTSVDTVQNYINYLCNSIFAYQVKRFDVKGKRLLESLEKYYLSDIGFRFGTIGYTPEGISGQLENLVFHELMSRGYAINIGKYNDLEIDFIAEKSNERMYIQVCTTLNDPKVIDREYKSLENIDNHFPKIVLSLDSGFDTNYKGVKWQNIKEFLMEGK